MPKSAAPCRSASDRLLETAIDHFGRHGFEGASTRDIAAAAGAQMSAITYHYGGKEGLYLAAARHIGDQMRAQLAAAFSAAPPQPTSREEAVAAVLAIVERFVDVMTHQESEAWARFIVREQMDPTEAFAVIFEVMSGFIGRMVGLIEHLATARDPREVRLRVLAIMGQALVFRVSRAALLRMTGWSGVDEEGAAEIRRVVRQHTLAILDSFGEADAAP